MQEEENGMESESQEQEASEAPAVEGGELKPKKAVPKVPKGAFKKPEKADLASVKGKFAKPQDGPVKKQSVERFAKKKGLNPKILGAIVGVAVVLVVVYLFVGRGTSGKMDAGFLRAVKAIQGNTEDGKRYEGMKILPAGSPKFEEYSENGTKAKIITCGLSIEKQNGSHESGSFKAKTVYFKTQWHLLYLEVTMGSGAADVILDKKLTEKGIMNK